MLKNLITIAVADADHDRRASYERAFLQSAGAISLLTNISSGNNFSGSNRRAKSRANMTIAENELARAKRLRPDILLVDVNLLSDPDCNMLTTMRQECPGTFVVLLADEFESEEMVLKALEGGARGYLSRDDAKQHISRVVSVISKGEFWVPRHMLGKIMDKIQSARQPWQVTETGI